MLRRIVPREQVGDEAGMADAAIVRCEMHVRTGLAKVVHTGSEMCAPFSGRSPGPAVPPKQVRNEHTD